MVYLQLATVVLVALAWALAMAHALELPGKMRLDEASYRTVQRIYYPGFTVAGGIGEAGGLLATVALWLLLPGAAPSRAAVLVALIALLLVQAVYWTWLHPVNKVWLEPQALGGAGARFFAAGGEAATRVDFRRLRGRWEYGHLLRAALATIGFVALLVSLVAPSR
jgi:hypothetical protein